MLYKLDCAFYFSLIFAVRESGPANVKVAMERKILQHQDSRNVLI